MALIDYEKYLDGDEWPSESKKAVVDERGFIEPQLVPVVDMPPQYAAAALHKLVKWAQEHGFNPQESEEYETKVRRSMLGKLLRRQALSIHDHVLDDPDPVTPKEMARLMVHHLFDIDDDIEAATAAKYAQQISLRLTSQGFRFYKESA